MCWHSLKELLPEEAVKKVLASLENCLYSLKELLKKCWKSLKNLLAFPKGAVKKVLASLEMCGHSQKELLKKCWQAYKSVGIS